MAQEFGIRGQWVDASRTHVGEMATAAGCIEFPTGPILLLASFVTSVSVMSNFEPTISPNAPVFEIAIPPLRLVCLLPYRFRWTQQIAIDSETIGEVLVGRWGNLDFWAVSA